MTEANPRAVPGANNPPLDAPEQLPDRLERDHAAIVDTALALDGERLKLAVEPQTEDEAAAIINWLASAAELDRKADKLRLTEGVPYREAQKVINDWFGEALTPVSGQIEIVKRRLGIYQRAKAAREEADRRARAEEERRRQAEEEAKAAAARRKAEEEEAQAQAAREALRSGEIKTAQARVQQEEELRRHDQAADQRRRDAEEAAQAAAQAARSADTHDRHAAAGVGALGRVTGAGASTATTTFWTHEIEDMPALRASLPVLGPYFSNDALEQAVRGAVKAGTRELAGTKIYQETRTDVRRARK